jgi:hypothetical protein
MPEPRNMGRTMSEQPKQRGSKKPEPSEPLRGGQQIEAPGGGDSSLSEGEGNPANEALRRLFKDLLAAFNDYRQAPEDDHRTHRDNAMVQLIAFVRFTEALSDLAPDGIEGIPLDLLPDPVRVLLDQLQGLQDGQVGPMLTPAERRTGRPSLTEPERRHRAICVAAWRIFQLAGLSAETAAARIVKARKEVGSLETLKQWAKDLQQPEAAICRRFVDEAEERLQEWRFTDAQVIDYADLLLLVLWS